MYLHGGDHLFQHACLPARHRQHLNTLRRHNQQHKTVWKKCSHLLAMTIPNTSVIITQRLLTSCIVSLCYISVILSYENLMQKSKIKLNQNASKLCVCAKLQRIIHTAHRQFIAVTFSFRFSSSSSTISIVRCVTGIIICSTASTGTYYRNS